MAEIQEQEPRKDPCDPCKEERTPTDKCINIERRKYCSQYYTAAGEVKKWQVSYKQKAKIYNQKKCRFVRTEKNYRIHRNLKITLGTKLVQSSTVLKENVTQYIQRNSELSTTLKDLLAEVKSLKSKMCDLRDQACKLENCINDSCNSSQWQVIIGKNRDETKTEYPQECHDVEGKFRELICWPKSLSFDIDSIFKSSAEVIGIQVFSNMASLESLQQTLSTCTTNFHTHLQQVVSARETDMKTLQEELVTAVNDTTTARVTRYNVRSDFEGLHNALYFMCCPDCDCVQEDCKCEPRLKVCEDKICEICKNVKDCFCCEEPHGHDHDTPQQKSN